MALDLHFFFFLMAVLGLHFALVLSLVVADGGGYSLVEVHGFSFQWILPLWGQD